MILLNILSFAFVGIVGFIILFALFGVLGLGIDAIVDDVERIKKSHKG